MKMILITWLLLCPFVVLAEDVSTSNKDSYRFSKELNNLINEILVPVRESIDGPRMEPVQANEQAMVIARIAQYKAGLEARDYGRLYKDFGSIDIRHKCWRKIIENDDGSHSRFMHYYPKVSDLDMTKIRKLLERLHLRGSAYYLPIDIVEMYMIENQDAVDEMCQVAFSTYVSTTREALLKDIALFDAKAMLYKYSMHDVKGVLFGSTAMGLMDDGLIWLYDWDLEP